MLYRPKQASFQTKTSLLQKLRYTAAASEAHMKGCIMPVITNPGNENHEIVSSLAAIIYKRGKRQRTALPHARPFPSADNPPKNIYRHTFCILRCRQRDGGNAECAITFFGRRFTRSKRLSSMCSPMSEKTSATAQKFPAQQKFRSTRHRDHRSFILQ